MLVPVIQVEDYKLADPASRRMATRTCSAGGAGVTRVGELLLARQAELDGGQG